MAAGYGWRGNFENQPSVRSMAEVNFSGALPLVQWAWRKMSTQNRKSVLTIIGSTSSVKARSDESCVCCDEARSSGFGAKFGNAGR